MSLTKPQSLLNPLWLGYPMSGFQAIVFNVQVGPKAKGQNLGS